jgi:hypothetical protein
LGGAALSTNYYIRINSSRSSRCEYVEKPEFRPPTQQFGGVGAVDMASGNGEKNTGVFTVENAKHLFHKGYPRLLKHPSRVSRRKCAGGAKSQITG